MSVKSFKTSGVGVDLAPQGLVLINTTSFSGVLSQSLSADTFTSTYENYKIIISFSSTANDGQIFLRLRASGVDNTAGYSWGIIGRNQGGTIYNNFAANDAAGFFLLNADSGQADITSVEMTLFNPQLARKTKFVGNAAGAESAGSIASFFGAGSHSSTSAFDSATFYNSSGGNLAGKVSVYGYNF
jgi:hypothetical protein